MAKRRRHLQTLAKKRQPGEKRTLGNITCRTKYLDDLVHLFTQECGYDLPLYFQALAQAVAASCKQAPGDVKQIVLIGAGMDTRSRRLDVPEDVQWFELDRASVLQMKQSLLRKKLQGQLDERVTQASCAPQTIQPPHVRILGCFCEQRVTRPRNMSHAAVFAGIDIGETPIKKALEGTGFDCSRSTVWVLEGLVMCVLLLWCAHALCPKQWLSWQPPGGLQAQHRTREV